MHKWLPLFIISCAFEASAQADLNIVEAKRILSHLASDELRGRATYSPEIDIAADFISNEFRTAGLQPWDDSTGYRQNFHSWSGEDISVKSEFDGEKLKQESIVVLTPQAEISVDETSGIPVWRIHDLLDKKHFFSEAYRLVTLNRDLIVVVPPSLHDQFAQLHLLEASTRISTHLIIFVKLQDQPKRFNIKAQRRSTEMRLSNIIGILPGRSKADEYVIFSAHYDHVGLGKNGGGDIIFNGANDNASGVTSLILLARHFTELNINERTILFIAFSGEELGLLGSLRFANSFPLSSVVTVINIEMIGNGRNGKKRSAYITGSEKSDLISLLNAELGELPFRFDGDPYPSQNLFERSDNFSFAQKGVVAHTIMSTRLNSYNHYHQVTDETRNIDFENLIAVTRAIAKASEKIVSGKLTPALRNKRL